MGDLGAFGGVAGRSEVGARRFAAQPESDEERDPVRIIVLTRSPQCAVEVFPGAGRVARDPGCQGKHGDGDGVGVAARAALERSFGMSLGGGQIERCECSPGGQCVGAGGQFAGGSGMVGGRGRHRVQLGSHPEYGVMLQRRDHGQGQGDVVLGHGPGVSGSQFVEVAVQDLVPFPFAGTAEARVGLRGKLTSRNNLAGAYQAAGRVTEAIPLYEQTLFDRERVLGPDHPSTLGSRNNLAGAYRVAGRETDDADD